MRLTAAKMSFVGKLGRLIAKLAVNGGENEAAAAGDAARAAFVAAPSGLMPRRAGKPAEEVFASSSAAAHTAARDR